MYKKLLFSVFAVVLLIGGFAIVAKEGRLLPSEEMNLIYEQLRLEDASDQVVDDQSILSQNEQVTEPDLISLYPQHYKMISGNAEEVLYNIPELGIRMKLNKEFAEDLIYSVSHIKKTYGEKEEVDIVYFSTKSMTLIDAFCAPDKGSSGGAISRNKGIAKEVAKTDEYVAPRLSSLIQIGDFYYIFEKPQATCWDPNLEYEVLKLDPSRYQGKGIKSLDEGFKNIQSIPEPDFKAGFVTDVDPDVNHWQTKETEFFTIKFPKEWYWSEAAPGSEFTPDGIITNNPNHPVQYPEIEANNFNNDTEVVIGYELLFASAGNIITIGVEDMTPVEGCEFLSDANSVPIIKSCVKKYENNQVERVYRMVYKDITVSLDVRTTGSTLVSKDILEKIAKSIVLTNKK